MRFSRILWGCSAPVNKKWLLADRLFDQQALDFGFVSRRNGARIAEVAFLFRRFFGQDVTVISVLALDLSCAGEGKTFLRRGIGFHFRHCRKRLIS